MSASDRARVQWRLPDAHLSADLGVRPLPPLVLRAGHVGEVVPLDEQVARVDGLPEVDDGAVALVLSCPAGQSIHPNVQVGHQDFQARRDAGESEARLDVCGGSRLILFPDALGLHNPATAPLAEEGERAAHG